MTMQEVKERMLMRDIAPAQGMEYMADPAHYRGFGWTETSHGLIVQPAVYPIYERSLCASDLQVIDEASFRPETVGEVWFAGRPKYDYTQPFLSQLTDYAFYSLVFHDGKPCPFNSDMYNWLKELWGRHPVIAIRKEQQEENAQ